MYKGAAKVLILILIIITLLAFGVGGLLEKVEVGEVAALKNTIENFMPELIKNNISNAKYPLLIITIIAIAIYLYKPQMALLAHASFNPLLAEVEKKEIEKEFYIKEQQIDLCEMVSKLEIGKAITIQDQIVKATILKKKNEIGYYGIAHTPFVFRVGFTVGDQKKVHLFHRARNNNALFTEWSEDKDGWDVTLEETKELNKGCKSQEIYVAIGTTFPIKQEEISSITGKDNHVLIFQTSAKGYDVIGSYLQAETLRDQILKTIRDCVKKYNIRKIHLMISSSVAFTFLLGSSFSAQHDPEVIVYHYENGKYTWGINMTKIGEEAVVNKSGN